MNTSPNDPNEFSVFSETPYDKEVLLDNLGYQSRKTSNALWIIAAVLFLSDLVTLFMANIVSTSNLIYILVIPVLFIGLGFLARSKPVLSMYIATLIFGLLIAYSIYIVGARSLISGLVLKAIIIYFFIKGFSHAFEAKKAQADLDLMFS